MIRHLLPFLVLAAASPWGHAQNMGNSTRWYQVEIIVFDNKDTADLQTEHWHDDPGAPFLGNTLELSAAGSVQAEPPSPEDNALAATAAEPPFQLLPQSQLQMADVAARLKRSSNYDVLLHAAWRQPVASSSQAQLIHLHSYVGQPGKDAEFLASVQPQPAAAPEAGPAFEASPAAESPLPAEAPYSQPMRPLDGLVRVSLNRYLHLSTDLVYRNEMPFEVEPAEQAQATESMPFPGVPAPIQAAPSEPVIQWREQSFRLTQSRRMRSGEIHYLDHPAFGIVALITPYETEPPADSAATPTAPF